MLHSIHIIHFDDQKIHSQQSPSRANVGESVCILIISTYHIYSKPGFLAKRSHIVVDVQYHLFNKSSSKTIKSSHPCNRFIKKITWKVVILSQGVMHTKLHVDCIVSIVSHRHSPIYKIIIHCGDTSSVRTTIEILFKSSFDMFRLQPLPAQLYHLMKIWFSTNTDASQHSYNTL